MRDFDVWEKKIKCNYHFLEDKGGKIRRGCGWLRWCVFSGLVLVVNCLVSEIDASFCFNIDWYIFFIFVGITRTAGHCQEYRRELLLTKVIGTKILHFYV